MAGNLWKGKGAGSEDIVLILGEICLCFVRRMLAAGRLVWDPHSPENFEFWNQNFMIDANVNSFSEQSINKLLELLPLRVNYVLNNGTFETRINFWNSTLECYFIAKLLKIFNHTQFNTANIESLCKYFSAREFSYETLTVIGYCRKDPFLICMAKHYR